MVVRAVELLVQLNDEALEKGGKLAFRLGRVVSLVLVNEPPLDPELPAGDAALLAVALPRGERGVGDEDPQLPLLLHRPLEGLLDVQPLPHDGRVELALKGEQVHVGLGLGHQLPNLLRQDLVRQLLFLLGRL